MRKAKILVLILLSVLVMVVCVGCVDTIYVTQYFDGNGKVHRDFLVVYDLNAPDAPALRVEIKKVMSRYVELHDLSEYATISEEVEGEIRMNLLFPSLEDYYMWLGYTGKEENTPETPSKKGVVNAYDRTINSYLTESNVEEIRSLVDEAYRDFSLTSSFYYTYGTTNRSTISNGERTEKDGVYYHTWKIEPGQDAWMTIRIYGLNVTLIYLIAISIFVLSLAIIFVIIYFKKRKEKIRATFPHDSPRLTESVASIGNGESSSVSDSGSSEDEDDKE